jgi:hypothetical protein
MQEHLENGSCLRVIAMPNNVTLKRLSNSVEITTYVTNVLQVPFEPLSLRVTHVAHFLQTIQTVEIAD